MHYSMWRGVAGLVKPTRRPGSLETLIRLLPEGVGVVPLLLDVRAGSHAEFSSAIPHYEKYVAELAEQGMDMIHPGGTPPFMLQGYKGEDKLIKSWEKKYKTPIFTSGQNHVHAMRALGIKKFIGASYSALQNKIVIDYMTEAGFKVVSMEPIDVPFNEARTSRRNGSMPTSRGCSARTRAPTASTSRAVPGTPRASSNCWSRTCRCQSCMPTSRRRGKS